MENYIINENTLAVIKGQNGTKIVEKYVTYNSMDSPFEIVNISCLFYGSSIMGRCASTEFLLGSKYKCPIIISEKKKIIFFPTSSYKNIECSWICVNAIKKYYEKGKNLCIILENDVEIMLNISKFVISSQILKSLRLESIIKGQNR